MTCWIAFNARRPARRDLVALGHPETSPPTHERTVPKFLRSSLTNSNGLTDNKRKLVLISVLNHAHCREKMALQQVFPRMQMRQYLPNSATFPRRSPSRYHDHCCRSKNLHIAWPSQHPANILPTWAAPVTRVPGAWTNQCYSPGSLIT